MLVLSRHLGERVIIDGNIEVTVIEIRGDRIKLGISAPPEVPVHREEVFRRLNARIMPSMRIAEPPQFVPEFA